MSQIRIHTVVILFILSTTAIGLPACSDRNPDSVINPETGEHDTGWIDEHPASYLSGNHDCTECHGDDLRGGISNVSCYTASFNGISCHANGPGSHPAGWSDPDSHGAAAKAAPSSTTGFSYCQQCHGTDFKGGIVGQSCFSCHGVEAPHSPQPWRGTARTHINTNPSNARVCEACHSNGQNSSLQPATPASAGTPAGCFNATLCHDSQPVPASHADPNFNPAGGAVGNPAFHGTLGKADLTYCGICHADNPGAGPGDNPGFNVATGTLTNGCEDCHPADSAHPKPWGPTAPDHQSAGNMANACVLCHGASLEGGSGPACSTCHTQGSPLTQTDCTSCHAAPPAGSSPPDREGAHAEHDSIPVIQGVCDTCHSGAGTGTATHDYTAGSSTDVSIDTKWDANAGTAAWNGDGTCSNVSCHGGIDTPDFLTGSIDLANHDGCLQCHTINGGEANSPVSGEHKFHVNNKGKLCTDCHDAVSTGKLPAYHFNDMDTPALNEADKTLRDAINYNGTTCNPQQGGLTGCHGQKTW